mmetsp:Transcript_31027/g.84916  ORF Transcript_31027/g.84916 Transcript_31027/m.84916 type:complete len:227 (-) Transcript_31027:422-1102(-)
MSTRHRMLSVISPLEVSATLLDLQRHGYSVRFAPTVYPTADPHTSASQQHRPSRSAKIERSPATYPRRRKASLCRHVVGARHRVTQSAMGRLRRTPRTRAPSGLRLLALLPAEERGVQGSMVPASHRASANPEQRSTPTLPPAPPAQNSWLRFLPQRPPASCPTRDLLQTLPAGPRRAAPRRIAFRCPGSPCAPPPSASSSPLTSFRRLPVRPPSLVRPSCAARSF